MADIYKYAFNPYSIYIICYLCGEAANLSQKNKMKYSKIRKNKKIFPEYIEMRKDIKHVMK